MEKKGIDFAAMPRTMIKVVTSPATFFREMPKTGGLLDPLSFMLVMAAATALVNAALGLAGLKFILSAGMAIAGLIIMPLIVLVGGFIWAAIVYVIWKLMGSQEPFETAYRCVAYLAALMPVMAVVGVLPYIGFLITIALWTFYYVMASIETHKIASQKAWLVFGIIGAAVFLVSLGAGMASRSLRHSMEQQGTDTQKDMEELKRKMEELQRQMKKK